MTLGASAAHADRREASLHAHAVAGLATAGDAAAAEDGSAPLGGLAVRASYATHNAFQYDAALTLLATGGAGFPSATFTPPGRPPLTGAYTVATQLARLDGGVTLRPGVVWIPTVRLAAGVQARRSGGPVVESGGMSVSGEALTGRGSDLGVDVVGVATVGLDHRVNRRLIVGAAVGASYAVPLGGEAFRTLEVTLHVSRYWYPR
ncbi:MAG: hypothetical protein HS111_12930 [Kofleriaceae bacterium]|nr:hypothetical protein [Kofleriaceae bacterium]